MSAKTIISKARMMGILTGSKVFGGYVKGKSDIDIVVPPVFKKNYPFEEVLLQDEAHYTPHAYRDANTTNLFISLGDKEYNIIYTATNRIFKIWREATKAMEAAIAASPSIKEVVAENKGKRIDMFQALRWLQGDDSLHIRSLEPAAAEEDDIPF